MKMKVTLLLLASVFFVSCGMPTIFAPIRNTDYTFSSLSADTDLNGINLNAKGELWMHLANPGINYDLLDDTLAKGPSLMFFYAFDNGTEIAHQFNDIGSFSRKFAEEYVKNKYEGIPVQGAEEILTVKINEMDAYLYGVSRENANNTFNAQEQYVLYAHNNGNKAKLDWFSLKPDPTGSSYLLNLTWADTSTNPAYFATNAVSASPNPGFNLYAFDGQPFPMDAFGVQTKIDTTDNHEYDFVGQNPTAVRIHLFAAFFISKPYTNNFWSDLVYLGGIPIALNP